LASVYKIGAASTKTGLSVATLRSWEDQYGLLVPRRTPGGTRLYSETDLDRARYIRVLIRERGYSLKAVSDALEEDELDDHDFHGVLRRLVRAQFGWPAAMSFVEGVKGLTGMAVAALALYVRWRDSLFFVVTVRTGYGRTVGGTAISVSEFPTEWQQAIDGHQPCAHPDLRRLSLPGSLGAWVRETRTRSFHAEPLTVGRQLLGVLMIGSPVVAGISRGAQEMCARLAIPAGPALSFFAAQF